jgi:heme A synthase
MDNVALFFHILGALLFVAGIVLAGAAFEAARRREQPTEIVLLLGLVECQATFAVLTSRRRRGLSVFRLRQAM